MFDPLIDAALWEWLSFAVRWTHVIVGIAWIGSSFYFIALDLGLVHRPHLPDGVKGEEWQVHGGGFYNMQKYMIAPPTLPEHLTWFKWESYSTWLSGFAMLAVLYYAQADLYLIDQERMALSPEVAILISVASLAVGWLLYDGLCRLLVGRNDSALMVLLFAVIVAMAWGYTQVFTGRAALLHLGAFTATIMSANVFFVIIPNQKVVVADMKAGRTPDPKYGVIAKQRSTHNNYLTLPVIFLMLSNHYPLATSTEFNWIIAALVFLMGVSIRHYFNTRHARKAAPNWTWAVTAALFAAIVALSVWPTLPDAEEEAAAATAGPQLAAADRDAAVVDIVLTRCSMCHAAAPVWDGIAHAPLGVVLENEAQVMRHAREIYLFAAASHAMPPGNLTYMEPGERRAIARWFAQGGGG
ncbi:MAG: urate hydroxylase PuuD [Sneathiellaceae bacterium]